MNDSNTRHKEDNVDLQQSTANSAAERKPRGSLSMHEGIPVWHDCCSCEPEPYWVEAMKDHDIDQNAD